LLLLLPRRLQRHGWRGERRRERWLLLLVRGLLRLLLGLQRPRWHLMLLLLLLRRWRLLLLPVQRLLLQRLGLCWCQVCHELQQLLQLRRGLRWRLLLLLCLLRCCLQLLQQLCRLLRGGLLRCIRCRRLLCRCRRRTGLLLLLRLHRCRWRLCNGLGLGTCAALLERWRLRTAHVCRRQP